MGSHTCCSPPQTQNRGQRMKEGAHINRSLLALGNCINALSGKGTNKYINYRDSKLTRLLKVPAATGPGPWAPGVGLPALQRKIQDVQLHVNKQQINNEIQFEYQYICPMPSLRHTLRKAHSFIQISDLIWGSCKGFPGGSVGKKQSACNAGDAGDVGLIPGSGRSPGGGHGNPHQCPCLENPMDRGASPQGLEELDTAEATELTLAGPHL